MIEKVSAIESPYLTSFRNSLTDKVSQVVNFVFSILYAVYDFPRSTNPVTQQREFRWIPIFVKQAIEAVAYPILPKKSGSVIQETDPIIW